MALQKSQSQTHQRVEKTIYMARLSKDTLIDPPISKLVLIELTLKIISTYIQTQQNMKDNLDFIFSALSSNFASDIARWTNTANLTGPGRRMTLPAHIYAW
jgi:hypothetical protein